MWMTDEEGRELRKRMPHSEISLGHGKPRERYRAPYKKGTGTHYLFSEPSQKTVERSSGDDIRSLCEALCGRDVQRRTDAAWELGTRGERAVAPLLEVLRNGDLDAQRWALWALAMIGPEAARAIPALHAIVKAEPDEPRELPAEERSPLTERLAEVAIASVGREAVPFLLDKARNGDRKDRRISIALLGELDSDVAPPVEDLIRWLDDPEALMRQYAVETLGEIGPRAKAALPHLRKKLSGADAACFPEAPIAMLKIGDDSPEVLAAIERALTRPIEDWQRLHSGLESVTERPRIDPAVAPKLSRWFIKDWSSPEESDVERRGREPAPPPADRPELPKDWPGILAGLRSGSEESQMIAAYAAACRKPADKAIHAELVRLLGSKHWGVQMNAGRALLALDPVCQPAIRHLAKAAKEPDDFQDPVMAVYVLEELAGRDVALEKDLIEILWRTGCSTTASSQHVEGAASAVMRQGRVTLGLSYLLRIQAGPGFRRFTCPIPRPLEETWTAALPLLRRALTFKAPGVRSEAAWALGSMGKGARSVIDDIRPLLKDRDPIVRVVAGRALRSIEGRTPGETRR
jgi:HEAT repeat protein